MHFITSPCRFQQELAKIAAQHAADVTALQKVRLQQCMACVCFVTLQQAHEAEMAAAHAREEANLMQVRALLQR